MDTAESAVSDKEATKEKKKTDTAESAQKEESKEKAVEATKEEKMDTDEVKEKKVEADHQMLANPARVLPQQVRWSISMFDLS